MAGLFVNNKELSNPEARALCSMIENAAEAKAEAMGGKASTHESIAYVSRTKD